MEARWRVAATLVDIGAPPGITQAAVPQGVLHDMIAPQAARPTRPDRKLAAERERLVGLVNGAALDLIMVILAGWLTLLDEIIPARSGGRWDPRSGSSDA
jgi:hypothetical protein